MYIRSAHTTLVVCDCVTVCVCNMYTGIHTVFVCYMCVNTCIHYYTCMRSWASWTGGCLHTQVYTIQAYMYLYTIYLYTLACAAELPGPVDACIVHTQVYQYICTCILPAYTCIVYTLAYYTLAYAAGLPGPVDARGLRHRDPARHKVGGPGAGVGQARQVRGAAARVCACACGCGCGCVRGCGCGCA